MKDKTKQNAAVARAKKKAAEYGAKTLLFVKQNYLTFGYIAAALLIELTGVAVTSGKFYMTAPWLYFTFVAIVALISLYLPGHKSRYALFVTALALNFCIDILFIVIFESTGGTVFDFAMIKLRADAMMIVAGIPINFTYMFVTSVIIALYCVLGHMFKTRMPKPNREKLTRVVTSSLLAGVFTANILAVYFTNYKYNADDLHYKIYQQETGTYSNQGIVGNLYSELVRGLFFSGIEVGDVNEMNQFVYSKLAMPTARTGIAKDFNVVTMLCESFEWFTFLYDAERYPNGFARVEKQTDGDKPDPTDESEPPLDEQIAYVKAALRELYPNLYRFYESDSTVILNNSHSLEKTDISENKAILGNYPLHEYINYSYPENSVPYSLPNIMKNMFGVESHSFHDGTNTFYNRNVHHVNALGFESYTSSESMDITLDESGLGQNNLDSEMLQSCKAEMFPTDRRFNTFITTITMHGPYVERKNLQPYYDKLDEYGLLPYTEGDDELNALRYYCAAGMDFDKAIGIMLDYLDENGLADNTLITLYGDHNAYYGGLSNYVKNIYSTNVPDYTELYRAPVMIKVGNESMGNAFIEKFTCVSDIYPTILDLLGVTAFTNLTYGTSAFSRDSSVLYSRAYGKFLTDKIYFNSLNNIIYKSADVTDAYIKEIETKSLALLDKISHVNRIFAGDFFKGRETEFYDRLRHAQID